MGTSYARNSLGLARPRVGLLNVGTEEHKGRAELHDAFRQLGAAAMAGDYEFVGFVEGSDIPSDRVDVIVTDGFTGNIALKTGEGTAKLISTFLREALTSTILAKIGALLAMKALRKLQAQTDPRLANGGVVSGVERHGGEIARFGRCHRHRGGGAAGASVVAGRSDEPHRGTGCIHRACGAGCRRTGE